MARPQSIPDERILNAAREVFLRDGPGATTAEIARTAGCSEGTLFKRYGSKHELFLAAMGIEPPDDAFDRLIDSIGTEPAQEALEALAHRMIAFFTVLLPRVHAVLSRGETLAVFAEGDVPPPVKHMRTIARFVAAQQERGAIAPMPPNVFARMFVGSVHFYAFSCMTDVNTYEPIDQGEYVSAFVARLVGAPEAS